MTIDDVVDEERLQQQAVENTRSMIHDSSDVYKQLHRQMTMIATMDIDVADDTRQQHTMHYMYG